MIGSATVTHVSLWAGTMGGWYTGNHGAKDDGQLCVDNILARCIMGSGYRATENWVPGACIA